SYLERLRSRFGSGPVLLVYATALIRDARGRVLFQRRGDFPIWGLPGGLLEPGETILETLTREAREETGYEVRPVRFIGLYSSPEYAVHYPNGDRVQQVTACFDCEIAGGADRPDGRESLAQEFLDPDDPPELFPWYRQMLRDRDLDGPTPFDRGAAEGENPYPEGIVRRLRAVLGREPILLPCAAAVIRDSDGRILFQQRADSGLWGLPSGGMEVGERIDRTVVREVREETGLTVRADRLTGFYAGPEQFAVYPNGDRAWLVVAVFLCSIESGDLVPDRLESLDLRFFPLDALPLDHEPWGPRTRRRIRDALEGATEAIVGS
ncbi:MAG: NUDIX domain-containing protein, partial [Candidatus Eisenbacteria bacterium]|nr:NUDIX domain-containing protein [Candidatus Latescibacterota bacterium]MBD3302157.1 NUDIX domain-containing protein [Candidatus Eisenbacteria bacterium]